MILEVTMTSWQGNAFYIDDPLSPVTGVISLQRTSNVELWCFFVVSLGKQLNKQCGCVWLRRHDAHVTSLFKYLLIPPGTTAIVPNPNPRTIAYPPPIQPLTIRPPPATTIPVALRLDVKKNHPTFTIGFFLPVSSALKRNAYINQDIKIICWCRQFLKPQIYFPWRTQHENIPDTNGSAYCR